MKILYNNNTITCILGKQRRHKASSLYYAVIGYIYSACAYAKTFTTLNWYLLV